MNRDKLPFRRRTVMKVIGAMGAIGGVSGTVSANNNGNGSGSGSSNNNRNPKLELVGHTTLGARDGGQTYGDVNEDRGLAAVGSFLFGGTELRIADISDPANPELVSTIITDPSGKSSDIRNVFFHPSKPWVLAANEGRGDSLVIIDVSNSTSPQRRGSVSFEDAGSGFHNITVLENDDDIAIASLQSQDRGIVVYDISDPDNPQEVSEFQKNGNRSGGELQVHATHTRDEYAFLAHWDSGLSILDMSNPANPTEVAAYDYTEEEAEVPLRNAHHAVPHPTKDLCLVGEEVGFDNPGYKHVIEFNVESGETELLSSFQFPQNAPQPTLNQAFYWTGHFSNWGGIKEQEDVLFSGDYKAGVQVFDLADPENPERIDQYYPTEGVGEVRAEDPLRSDLIDNVPFTWNARTRGSEYIYASDITTGLYIFTLEGY